MLFFVKDIFQEMPNMSKIETFSFSFFSVSKKTKRERTVMTINNTRVLYLVSIDWILKKRTKPVLLLHSPFLLPSFFIREEKKGKK
jgi:hypothetical protein